MDEFAAMRMFVQVVEHGSFSAAARRSASATSSVARQVKALETHLGARLLNKTTRQQGLTEAGRTYFERAKAILDEVDRANREVASFHRAVRGSLRVYLRHSAGAEVIVPALPGFLARHPGLVMDVVLADERVDLVAEGIDVAVWLGQLEDSTLVARRLSASRRVLCGSPLYFRKHGVPRQPSDLARHNCLVYKASRYRDVWHFSRGSQTIDVPVTGNLKTASSSVLLASALQGLGLIVSQRWMVMSALADGRLRTALDDYEVSPTDFDAALYAVYPHGRGLSAKARAFVDFLVELFAGLEGEDGVS